MATEQWSFGLNGGNVTVYERGGRQQQVADVYADHMDTRIERGHLIAAAPELLAACEDALSWVAVATPDKDAHPKARANHARDLAALQAAIAKARGL